MKIAPTLFFVFFSSVYVTLFSGRTDRVNRLGLLQTAAATFPIQLSPFPGTLDWCWWWGPLWKTLMRETAFPTSTYFSRRFTVSLSSRHPFLSPPPDACKTSRKRNNINGYHFMARNLLPFPSSIVKFASKAGRDVDAFSDVSGGMTPGRAVLDVTCFSFDLSLSSCT